MPGKNVAERPQLALGALAYDTRTDAVGVVMDTGAVVDGRYSLRPPRGGVEWSAERADVRPATVADQLRPALAEASARSRGGQQ
ncbi:hypothetical protein [Streptomyces uncialis]|uniref:hypothetical protein n=1 Tax=Streptomyces uncialis TaxID=1048205 RepID=UPI00224E69D7|nr:hypothetical protein [Streptomyces uncialis]MCX4663378.1 hypothetical protein [Streptomyces uncialis]